MFGGGRRRKRDISQQTIATLTPLSACCCSSAEVEKGQNDGVSQRDRFALRRAAWDAALSELLSQTRVCLDKQERLVQLICAGDDWYHRDCEHDAQGMALCEKGSFFYKQDNENYVVIDQLLTARVARLNNNVARLYLVDGANAQQQIPQHITLTDETGANVPPFLDNFLITWTSSYTLWVHGHEHMVLNNQKKQSIRGVAEAASGIV